MDDNLTILEPLFEKAEQYGKTSLELIKLKALDKTSGVISTFVSRGMVVLVLSMFIAFINIGVAIWLGDLLGKLYLGFFCVAGFYGVTGFVIYFFMNDWIKKHVSTSVISQMLN